MKKVVFYLVFMAGFSLVCGQMVTDSMDHDQLDFPQLIEQEKDASASQKRLSASFMLGSSFVVSPGNFYGPTVYAAPALNYQFNPRFAVSAGAGIEQGSFYSLSRLNDNNANLMPMTRVFIFTRGVYQVTDRLSLGGTAYQVINRMPALNPYSSPYQQQFQSIGVDLNYKLSPAFSIGFRMRVQHGGYLHDNELIPAEGYVPWGGF
ncbi:MAG: hypothetical protein JW801_14275 [Bacteroidales bacterium]|nr:hypothetical protein [Bacteroidales bacterium]